MFRALHVTSSLGFNYLKSLTGMKATDPATCLQQIGGIYSKVAQQTRITDPTDELYNECKQVNEAETKQRLVDFLKKQKVPVESMALLGTGSIGAVYMLKLKSGEHLVFKVQYVGIRELWEQDMKAMEYALNAKDFMDRQNSDSMMKQLRKIMNNELNYRHELKSQEWFYKKFKDQPEYVVPQPKPEMCAEHVLVTQYVGGETLLAFKKRHEGERQDKINAMAARILKFHVMSSVEGYVYADFHWGNLKVVEDVKLCVLDYGMVDQVPPKDVPPYLKMHLLAVLGDKDRFLHVLRTEQSSLKGFEREVWELYTLSTEPYRASDGFTYTQDFVDQISHKLTSFRSDLPEGCLCVMRAELLLCNVFVCLRATIPRNFYEWVIYTYVIHLPTEPQPYFRSRFQSLCLFK